jgi:flagellar biosynthetic protein FliQ
MSTGDLAEIMRASVLCGFKLAGPILILSIVVGLIISVLQAATSINEQTLTFVPKVVIVAIVLIFGGTWMLQTMIDFTEYIFDIIVKFG